VPAQVEILWLSHRQSHAYWPGLWPIGPPGSGQVSCNLHSVITEPGTIEDLVADATTAGFEANARLIRDWTQQGLLDYPQRRPAGKGHGSAASLYPASQRNLLLTLLYQRPGKTISSLARVPVAIWMYWGQEHVPLRQAHRALLRHLGDPESRTYARDAPRASKDRARATARIVARQLDNPRATPAARRELLSVLTEIAWTGRPDFARLERALTAVFDAGATRIRRATGHPAAPVTTEAMITAVRARLEAVTALTAGKVTGEMLARARDAHLFHYAEYIAMQPALAATTPPGIPQLYAPVTAEDTLANCCGNLLSALGLEILFPHQAELMRQARASMRHPGPAELGLTAEAVAASREQSG
jgi:hypothetical protein